MGCGESKHDAVATGNTIFRRKRSTKKAAAKDDSGGDQKNPTPEKATAESNVAAAAAVDPARDAHVQEGQSATDPSEHHATDVANNESDVVSTVVEARDVKSDDDGVGVGVVDTANDGNNHDDQLGIDGLISDGRSGKSEYNTPPRGSSAESVNRTAEDSLIKPDDQIDNDGGAENDIVTTVDQELADNTDQTKPAQQDQTGEEKSGDVEENVEKEELEVSVPAQEENGTITPNAEEKHVVDSPTKELKTV